MAFDWKPVIDGVVSIVNNIFATSKEKKAKKAADNAAAEASAGGVPDGQYLGVDGVLYPTTVPGQTMATIEKKAAVFGKKPDMSLYEDAGADALGNRLYRVKNKVAAMPSTGGKSNNLLGDVFGGIFGSKDADAGNAPKEPNNTVKLLSYLPTVALLGGAGYGAYWVYKKYK